MAAIAELFWQLFDSLFALLASFSIVSPREGTEARDRWTVVATLLVVIGSIAVVVAMILTLSHLRY